MQLVADQVGISVDRAKAMMKDFLDRYQGVLRFLHLLKQLSKKISYVETLLGRRWYLSGLGSGDWKLRAGDRATSCQHTMSRVGRRLDHGRCHHHTMRLLIMLTGDT